MSETSVRVYRAYTFKQNISIVKSISIADILELFFLISHSYIYTNIVKNTTEKNLCASYVSSYSYYRLYIFIHRLGGKKHAHKQTTRKIEKKHRKKI